jgi:protein-disulfide isomerase
MTQTEQGNPRPKRRGGRLRPYMGTVVVLAVIFGGSAAIGAHVRGAKEDKVKAPSGATGQDSLAMPVKGTTPVTLTVYADLRDPKSKAFETTFSDTFTQLLKTGQIELDYQLTTVSDQKYGGRGALTAANAAACAQDQKRFKWFLDQVWKAQPADVHDDALNSTALMKRLARRTHHVDMTKFVPCVQGGDHDGWVHKEQRAFTAAGYSSVPVLLVNGQQVPTAKLTPAKLVKLVTAAAYTAEGTTPPKPKPRPTVTVTVTAQPGYGTTGTTGYGTTSGGTTGATGTTPQPGATGSATTTGTTTGTGTTG